jgi:hypothetical protein
LGSLDRQWHTFMSRGQTLVPGRRHPGAEPCPTHRSQASGRHEGPCGYQQCDTESEKRHRKTRCVASRCNLSRLGVPPLPLSRALCRGVMALTSLHAREAKMCDDMPNDLGINARALPTKPIEERMTTEDIDRSWNTLTVSPAKNSPAYFISIASIDHPARRGHREEAKRGPPWGQRITRHEGAMVP